MESSSREIMEPFVLDYTDLLLLSSSDASSLSPIQDRLQDLSASVLHALGPSGPGLLCIAGVPHAAALRSRLLSLARPLALLPGHLRNPIFKENGLGSDVSLKNPDRTVSSFALQLKYDPEVLVNTQNEEVVASRDTSQLPMMDSKFGNLGSFFRALGTEMLDLGIRIAKICDRTIGGHELENSILESCTAKGRLIHYHSDLDSYILKEYSSRGRNGSKIHKSGFSSSYTDVIIPEERMIETAVDSRLMCKSSVSDLWQQWHYDYGIFTVLTAPMFMLVSEDGNDLNLPQPSSLAYPEHSFLQIFDPRRNKILLVKTSPDNFIVQVGESADILSKGKLRSTLHSVCRSVGLKDLCRETFVVFLQPAWAKKLYIYDYQKANEEALELNDVTPYSSSEERSSSFDRSSQELSEDIHEKIPPLLSRLRDGMTFAEFSRQTTKQYYGGNGVQSMKS